MTVHTMVSIIFVGIKFQGFLIKKHTKKPDKQQFSWIPFIFVGIISNTKNESILDLICTPFFTNRYIQNLDNVFLKLEFLIQPTYEFHITVAP